ncbi:MAG TPA: hypothetical protein VEW74_03795 [Candidatus Nitrosotalea sp.]|nr:hypothetical protein [Candidatus Nitrosotalea sp.]
MKNLHLLLILALAACGAPFESPPRESTALGTSAVVGDSIGVSASSHLYVSFTSATGNGLINRYSLVKGVPSQKPDRTYNGYGGLLSMGSDGTLYVGDGTPSGTVIIYVFPPNRTKPDREIEIPDLGSHCGYVSSAFTTVSGLGTDSLGHLFAAIYTYHDAARRREGGRHAPPPGRWPCSGVVVYAPHARGKARPLGVIDSGHRAPVSLAVDAGDDLYVAFDQRVVEYANAIVKPTIARVFHGDTIGPVRSVALDAGGNIFIASTTYGYTAGWIDRYSPGANGHRPPTSQITLPASKYHFLPSIAVQGRVLYADDNSDGVDLYHSRQNGDQSPFYSFSSHDVASIATGP